LFELSILTRVFALLVLTLVVVALVVLATPARFLAPAFFV
jgi:hypothetical protein